MIKQLRRKFIAIALASVAIVLLVIVGGINISNYIAVMSREDARADLVAAVDGDLAELDGDRFGEAGEKRGPGGPADFQGQEQGFELQGLDSGLGREAPFDTRYFIVWVDADDDDGALAVSADLSHIVSIDATEALDLGERAWRSNRDRGTIDGFRFLRCEIDDEDAIVFVDISRDASSFRSFALASAVASVAGLLAVAAILVPVSAIVVRPIEESQERQRRNEEQRHDQDPGLFQYVFHKC